ncbi:MAG: divalent-cation tolerance protein CutA [Pseudomonadota bacterium]|nr:divalent-cation tolerance protein CutA [Pseudomonadota bacterium]
MPELISIHITFATPAEAERVAQALVNEKMAACVHLIPGIRSIYRWQGQMQQTEEILLVATTRAELFEPLRKFVKALHSYDCPCIVAFPVFAGHPPYLEWVVQETTP